LKVQRATAVQFDTPSLFVLEPDAFRADVEHPHAIPIRDIQGGRIAGDPCPVTWRQLAAGFFVHAQLKVVARVDFEASSVLAGEGKPIVRFDLRDRRRIGDSLEEPGDILAATDRGANTL